ncbi:MAG: SpoIIE family protein phosphatase [Clostridia bacterium]|nr:SpoIIE family protein phosphatase [Clostridia bacterium]
MMMFAGKPSPLMLAGLAASVGMRALYGLGMDWWQYAGCAALWLVKQKFKLRPGVETAVLGGLAMMPRVLAAVLAHDSFATLMSIAAVPVAMLFSAAFRHGMDAFENNGTVLRETERFCLLLFALLIISGLGFFRVGPVNLGELAAVWAVGVYACLNGPMHGGACGLLCGLALAMGGHDSRLSVALALGGLLAGLPRISRMRWLCVLAMLLGNLLAWFATPLMQPPVPWLVMVLGTLALIITPDYVLEKWKPYLQGIKTGDRSMENAFVTERIAHMREAIQNLARALPQCEEEALSTGEELGSLLCAQCTNQEQCWGHSRTRTEKMLSASMEMSRKGEKISEDTLPSLAEHGCLRAEAIGEMARDAHLNRKRRSAAISKARYERELTLTHLAALSGTLGELGTMTAGDSYNDLIAAHVISLALDEVNMPARLSYARRVDGHLQAALEVHSVMPVQKQLDQLLRHLSENEGMALSISRAEKGKIELEEIPLYSASVGMASLCADGEKGSVCGDACSAKRCEGGRLLMMLCDGMGHGEKAHQQSEKTLELLLLLLEAGYTRHQAITAVNGIMLGVEETERFSTVDLVDVDLWTGEVYGEKLGACASWVVRGRHMKKIEGSSLPLGILREAAPTAAQYRLHSGDILVLMSDGVADVFENDAQWRETLEESIFIQPQRMADAILRNALLAAGGTPRDDMSVMVLLLMDRQQANS